MMYTILIQFMWFYFSRANIQQKNLTTQNKIMAIETKLCFKL